MSNKDQKDVNRFLHGSCEVSTKCLDVVFASQMKTLHTLILRLNDKNELNICCKWLKAFNSVPNTKGAKFARNTLCELLQMQLQEFEHLTEPFTNFENCIPDLTQVLREVDFSKQILCSARRKPITKPKSRSQLQSFSRNENTPKKEPVSETLSRSQLEDLYCSQNSPRGEPISKPRSNFRREPISKTISRSQLEQPSRDQNTPREEHVFKTISRSKLQKLSRDENTPKKEPICKPRTNSISRREPISKTISRSQQKDLNHGRNSPRKETISKTISRSQLGDLYCGQYSPRRQPVYKPRSNSISRMERISKTISRSQQEDLNHGRNSAKRETISKAKPRYKRKNLYYEPTSIRNNFLKKVEQHQIATKNDELRNKERFLQMQFTKCCIEKFKLCHMLNECKITHERYAQYYENMGTMFASSVRILLQHLTACKNQNDLPSHVFIILFKGFPGKKFAKTLKGFQNKFDNALYQHYTSELDKKTTLMVSDICKKYRYDMQNTKETFRNRLDVLSWIQKLYLRMIQMDCFSEIRKIVMSKHERDKGLLKKLRTMEIKYQEKLNLVL